MWQRSRWRTRPFLVGGLDRTARPRHRGADTGRVTDDQNDKVLMVRGGCDLTWDGVHFRPEHVLVHFWGARGMGAVGFDHRVTGDKGHRRWNAMLVAPGVSREHT